MMFYDYYNYYYLLQVFPSTITSTFIFVLQIFSMFLNIHWLPSLIYNALFKLYTSLSNFLLLL